MSIAEDLPAALAPWITDDYPDFGVLAESVGLMFAEVELYSEDGDEEGTGWCIVWDVERCPLAALPYVAMFLGERLPVGLDEAGIREWLGDAPNRQRGTPYALFRAAQRHLTGGRIVVLVERAGGDVELVRVFTLEDQTPSPAQTELDVRSVLPFDVKLEYDTTPGQLWSDVRDNDGYTDWQDVKDTGMTWAELAAVPPAGGVTWGRGRRP